MEEDTRNDKEGELARALHMMPEVVTEGRIGPDDDRLHKGFVYVSGRVKFASGEVLPAVLDISVHDQGEHYGAFVLLSGMLFDLRDDSTVGFLENHGVDVFPYDYNYDPVIGQDIHIGNQPDIRELTDEEEESLEETIAEYQRTGKIHEFK